MSPCVRKIRQGDEPAERAALPELSGRKHPVPGADPVFLFFSEDSESLATVEFKDGAQSPFRRV